MRGNILRSRCIFLLLNIVFLYGHGQHYHYQSPLKLNYFLYQSRMGRSIFDAPIAYTPSCVGSIKIGTREDEEGLIFTDFIPRTRIRYQNVTASGCGCFTIHSGREGGGSRRFIFPTRTFDRSDIGFPRIRSIFRVKCSAYYS